MLPVQLHHQGKLVLGFGFSGIFWSPLLTSEHLTQTVSLDYVVTGLDLIRGKEIKMDKKK